MSCSPLVFQARDPLWKLCFQACHKPWTQFAFCSKGLLSVKKDIRNRVKINKELTESAPGKVWKQKGSFFCPIRTSYARGRVHCVPHTIGWGSGKSSGPPTTVQEVRVIWSFSSPVGIPPIPEITHYMKGQTLMYGSTFTRPAWYLIVLLITPPRPIPALRKKWVWNYFSLHPTFKGSS